MRLYLHKFLVFLTLEPHHVTATDERNLRLLLLILINAFLKDKFSAWICYHNTQVILKKILFCVRLDALILGCEILLRNTSRQ